LEEAPPARALAEILRRGELRRLGGGFSGPGTGRDPEERGSRDDLEEVSPARALAEILRRGGAETTWRDVPVPPPVYFLKGVFV